MSKGNKIFSGFSAKCAAGALIFFVLLSLLAPIIANQNPLVVKENGEWYWPAFSNTRIIPLKNGKGIDLQRMSKAEWDKAFDFVVNPLFAYSPNTLDFNVGSLAAPSVSKQHVLGTDELGRDVLAILIHGAKWSVGIGFGAMLLSLIIGVLLGALAGYFGESGIQISFVEIVMQCLTAFWAGFYFLFLPAKGAYQLNIILGILIISALMLLVRFISKKWLKNRGFIGRKMTISIDSVVSRLIESLTAMPKLLFVLAAVAV
ncbi:MAG: hypothetical protein KDC92_16815, partial [Bacteroidetes bacterium]|nr:hypothetical protein [Bacteroidota bacterium]